MLVDHHSARRVRERLDAQNEHDGAGAAQLRRSSDSVAAAAPSQQQLRRSSTTLYNLAHNWSSHRHVPPRGAADDRL